MVSYRSVSLRSALRRLAPHRPVMCRLPKRPYSYRDRLLSIGVCHTVAQRGAASRFVFFRNSVFRNVALASAPRSTFNAPHDVTRRSAMCRCIRYCVVAHLRVLSRRVLHGHVPHGLAAQRIVTWCHAP